jgi:hypothetical protein
MNYFSFTWEFEKIQSKPFVTILDEDEMKDDDYTIQEKLIKKENLKEFCNSWTVKVIDIREI